MDQKLVIFQAYESLLGEGRSVTYCSAPLTSGKLFFEWVARLGRTAAKSVDHLAPRDREAHDREVVHPNRLKAAAVVTTLRKSGLLVIDPTTIQPISGWTQEDWVVFWESIIDRFANQVVVVDGWEYSFGCMREFYFACRLGMPVLDERIQNVSRQQGVDLIQTARSRVLAMSGPTETFDMILAAFDATKQ